MSERGGYDIERLWNWISRSTRNLLKMASLKFSVVVCRIRLFPTLISKIKWVESGLSLISKWIQLSTRTDIKHILQRWKHAACHIDPSNWWIISPFFYKLHKIYPSQPKSFLIAAPHVKRVNKNKKMTKFGKLRPKIGRQILKEALFLLTRFTTVCMKDAWKNIPWEILRQFSLLNFPLIQTWYEVEWFLLF